MFHAPYGGSPRKESKVIQYWGVFVEGRMKPIALFEKHDVAELFKEMMTDGKCELRPYCFRVSTI